MADPGRIPGPELIDNCVQVRLAWALANGRVAYSVLHARKTAGQAVNVALATSFFTPLVASFSTANHLGSVISSNQVLTGSDMRDLSNPGNFPLVAATNSGAAGTGGTIALPPNVALVLTLRTAQAGQGFRGRVYQPGLASADDQAPGNASPATTAALTQWGADLQAAFNAAGLTWAIAQPARQAYTGHGGRQHPARNAGMVNVTSWVVRNAIFDSQRRRSGRS